MRNTQWLKCAISLLLVRSSLTLCTSYTSCATCIQDTTTCGWCSSSQQCQSYTVSYPCSVYNLRFDSCPVISTPAPAVYSACSGYYSCSSCTPVSNCGWCSTSQQCQSGTSGGSSSCSYSNWVYYSSSCSSGSPASVVCSSYSGSSCSLCTFYSQCGWCSSSLQCQTRTSINNGASCTYSMWVYSSSSCSSAPATCSSYSGTSCGSCTALSQCGWCSSSSTCSPGTRSGPNSGLCSSWVWTSCPEENANSVVVPIIAAIASIGGVALFVGGIAALWYCVCRGRTSQVTPFQAATANPPQTSSEMPPNSQIYLPSQGTVLHAQPLQPGVAWVQPQPLMYHAAAPTGIGYPATLAYGGDPNCCDVNATQQPPQPPPPLYATSAGVTACHMAQPP